MIETENKKALPVGAELFTRQDLMFQIKEIKVSNDLQEIADLLASEKWVAFATRSEDGIILGRLWDKVTSPQKLLAKVLSAEGCCGLSNRE